MNILANNRSGAREERARVTCKRTMYPVLKVQKCQTPMVVINLIYNGQMGPIGIAVKCFMTGAFIYGNLKFVFLRGATLEFKSTTKT